MGRFPGVRAECRPWGGAWGASLALLLTACATDSASESGRAVLPPAVTSGAALPAEAGATEVEGPGPFDRRCELVDRVEEATRADDPQVRRGAVYLLGLRGPGSSLDVVGAAVRDPDPAVRQAAVESVCNIARRSVACAPAAIRILLEVAESPEWIDRKNALVSLSQIARTLSTEQETVVRRRLDDDAGDVQVAAGLVLHRAQLDQDLEPRVAQWLTWHAPGDLDYLLAQLLDVVADPTHMRAVERLFQSQSAGVRHLAHVAYSRLEGAPERWAKDAALENECQDTTSATSHVLDRETWIPADRDELLAAVHDARLVIFGETHRGPGAMRDAQAQALCAFVRRPEVEALGYEPSVRSAQEPILRLARKMGMQVIPLEKNWENLVAANRSGARDLEARDAIEAFLGADPAHRMFVIRGESHVHPGGFLLRRLSEEPLLLLSVVQLPLWQTGLFGQGSTHRSTTHPNVYRVGCEDEAPTVFPRLVAWLGGH